MMKTEAFPVGGRKRWTEDRGFSFRSISLDVNDSVEVTPL